MAKLEKKNTLKDINPRILRHKFLSLLEVATHTIHNQHIIKFQPGDGTIEESTQLFKTSRSLFALIVLHAIKTCDFLCSV